MQPFACCSASEINEDDKVGQGECYIELLCGGKDRRTRDDCELGLNCGERLGERC